MQPVTLTFHILYTWNLKQPLFNGRFIWMIPNLYMKNGCFTKHPLKKMLFGVPGMSYTAVVVVSHHTVEHFPHWKFHHALKKKTRSK